MGKGRKAVEKIGKGISIGSKREIVTTMGPVRFMVWSLLFSRGGLLGVVLLMRTVTTATMTMMMMIIAMAAQNYL